MSLKMKLNRLKSHMNIETKENPDLLQSNDQSLISIDIPYQDKWLQNNTNLYHFDDSYCFIREVRYPLDYQHGHYSFAAVTYHYGALESSVTKSSIVREWLAG